MVSFEAILLQYETSPTLLLEAEELPRLRISLPWSSITVRWLSGLELPAKLAALLALLASPVTLPPSSKSCEYTLGASTLPLHTSLLSRLPGNNISVSKPTSPRKEASKLSTASKGSFECAPLHRMSDAQVRLAAEFVVEGRAKMQTRYSSGRTPNGSSWTTKAVSDTAGQEGCTMAKGSV